MRIPGFLRPAIGLAYDRVGRPSDRPGGGVLLLDRSPLASPDLLWSRMHPTGALAAIIAVLVILACAAFETGYPPVLVVSAFMCLGVIGQLAYCVRLGIVGREQLEVDERGLDYQWTPGLSPRRRVIPFAEVLRLIPYWVTVPDGRHGRAHAEFGLAIETVGRPLLVGRCRDPEAVYWLHDELLRAIGDWCQDWTEAPPAPGHEVLDAAGLWSAPPTDNRLVCRREWDRTEFEPDARDHAWIARPIAWFLAGTPPVLALLLARFLPVTAGMILAAWGTSMLLAIPPRRVWIVRPGEVTTSFKLWGLGRSRTADIEWLKPLELRRRPSPFPWETRFDLALIDLDDAVKVAFGPLTEGEARWMAGIVTEVLKDALPHGGQEVYRWNVSVDKPTEGSRVMADAWLDEPGEKKAEVSQAFLPDSVRSDADPAQPESGRNA